MKTPTDEQLNLAMCEWMGWTPQPDGPKDILRKWFPPGLQNTNDAADLAYLPNYLSDDSPRQMINEAEEKLDSQQKITYTNHLMRSIYVIGYRWILVSATARQRVIAILKTVKPELFQ